jgi:hypothetical protein
MFQQNEDGKIEVQTRRDEIAFGYDILSAGMLWKPKEARIFKKFIDQPVNIL